jgi:hypothetical protein
VHLLEAHGVRVFALPPDCAKAGSFSRLRAKPAQNDATPLIFLRPGQSRHLDRRGAARALGRLVLDPDTPTPDWREQEHRAGRFAGAFLMPRGGILTHMPDNASTERILEVNAT